MSIKRHILVTSALPYANGQLHLGHMMEQIQTDIWVRFQRSLGNECFYVCADDTHGTAVMLRAEKEGLSAEEWIGIMQADHLKDAKGFHIQHDNYYSTHSPENKAFAELIYSRLQNKGQIKTQSIKQLYDPEKQLFLADRFVKGTCPKCHAPDQYGDACENCSATYEANELINPRSVYTGATPIEKISEHYFFDLPQYTDMLRRWTRSGTLQNSVANKLAEWLDAGLQAWDISRDAPYFGFEIPGAPDKFFYVWLDAPIGYMASFKNLCDQTPGLNFDDYWSPGSKTELHHFIGKDIINFHALFWPAMLTGAGFKTPDGVYAHGYLSVNGEKMSKSRGTFIMARTYLQHLDPDCLRYYFAAKLGAGVEDVDLNLHDFMQRVNTDLVNKFVNIASRCAGFIKKAGGTLAANLAEPDLVGELAGAKNSIVALYEQREYSKAVREIMQLADKANEYIQAKQPWALAKDPTRQQEVLAVCSVGIELFRLLAIYLSPILPGLSAKVAEFLDVRSLTFNDIDQPLLNHRIRAFKPLLTRIEKKQIGALVDASKADAEREAGKTSKTQSNAKKATPTSPPPAEPIDIKDFSKVDLRIAKVLRAEAVEGADKLIKLQLDLGADETRQVFSGIKAHYQPEQLVGKKVLMVYNLAPRKMRFGLSEGMILAAGGDSGLWVIEGAAEVPPGTKVG